MSGEEEMRPTFRVSEPVIHNRRWFTDYALRWQKLRSAEVAFEKEMKEMGLSKLATSEREIRKRIEDITDPQQPLSAANLPHTNGKGGKSKVNGAATKTGKKRKAAAWA